VNWGPRKKGDRGAGNVAETGDAKKFGVSQADKREGSNVQRGGCGAQCFLGFKIMREKQKKGVTRGGPVGPANGGGGKAATKRELVDGHRKT